MAALEPRIFIGTDHRDATEKLAEAIADGSFPVVKIGGLPMAMWITSIPVTPGAMQRPSYELHVTAWVETTNAAPETHTDETGHHAVQSVVESIHEERR